MLAETIEAAKRANVIKTSSLKRVIVDTTVMVRREVVCVIVPPAHKVGDGTGRSVGRSLPVHALLANCDHPVGDTCGIVDMNGSSSPLGVDALLTDNRLNDGGKQATRSRLSTTERVFTPNTEGGRVFNPLTCCSRHRMV